MTYDESLEKIQAIIDGTGEVDKDALSIACNVLKDAIGRGRRSYGDLEFAETDYVSDFADNQGLHGDGADDYFGDVKADGFDLMEAFHEGAQWQAKRGITTKGKLSSFGGSTCFFVPSDVTKQIYHDGVDRYKDVKLQIIKD
jgi:hypothetical protein